MSEVKGISQQTQVQLGLVITILIMLAGAISSFVGLNYRVSSVEDGVRTLQPLSDRTTRIETKVENIERILTRTSAVISRE